MIVLRIVFLALGLLTIAEGLGIMDITIAGYGFAFLGAALLVLVQGVYVLKNLMLRRSGKAVFALIFALIGVLYLTKDFLPLDLPMQWVLAAALIIVGFSF